MRKGFTLIELLVVVLIMGILASVAMPMYFKSVEKSRVSEVVSFLRTYMDAQDRYWMKTGRYVGYYMDVTRLLDIEAPFIRGTEAGSKTSDAGSTTYFFIRALSPSYIDFERKTEVPFYGKYKIRVLFDNTSSPYRIKNVVGFPSSGVNFDGLLSSFESFSLNCSGRICNPKNGS